MKSLNVKGAIAAIACVVLIVSYAAFSYYYYEKGIKLNELYFIGSSMSIFVFTYLLSTFFKHTAVRLLLIYVSLFYVILIVSYIWSWITYNHAYIYIKFSLFSGFAIGILYATIDTILRIIKNRPNGSD